MKKILYSYADISGYKILGDTLKSAVGNYYEFERVERPDYIFCSCFGKEALKMDGIRIQYIGENICPDFNVYDYAIGFHFIDFEDRYIRFPLYAMEPYQIYFEKALNKHLVSKKELEKKEKFCSFVVSNGRMEDERTKIFLKLNEYKRVASGGKFLKNVDEEVKGIEGKKLFQKKCKFAIACENSSALGYTTEKLVEAWAANTIPIYWGNPNIGKEFNTKAFINCHEFNSLDAVIDRVKEIDNNDRLYMEMMQEPILYEGCLAEQYITDKLLKDFLIHILDQKKEKAFRRFSLISQKGFWYENELMAHNSPCIENKKNILEMVSKKIDRWKH